MESEKGLGSVSWRLILKGALEKEDQEMEEWSKTF